MTAQRIATFAREHLVADQFSLSRPGARYPVHSLYLDSDDFASYWATVRRNSDRFKLRIRFYDDDEATPAYVEIKRRLHNATLKKRCRVPRRTLPEILAGRTPIGIWADDSEPGQMGALTEFVARLNTLQASPKVHVAYLREAYVSRDNKSVRLTFDREIRWEPAAGGEVTTRMKAPRPLFGCAVVLEVKVAGPDPSWLRVMKERFELRSNSCAKYVAAMTQHGFNDGQTDDGPVRGASVIPAIAARVAGPVPQAQCPGL